LPRRALAPMFDDSGADLLYVVARAHDEVRDRGGAACFVQQGLLASKLTQGRAHPFIRALGDVETLFDCTLGLGSDAIHAHAVLRCRIVGCEASLVLCALLEDGFARLGVDAQVKNAHALETLRACGDDSFDVVTLDPMMTRPKRSAPSFEILRRLALHERASPELLIEARRVARKRVVLKLGKGQPLPPGAPIPFARCEPGAHVSYWVSE
jgi:hypothetical protein